MKVRTLKIIALVCAMVMLFFGCTGPVETPDTSTPTQDTSHTPTAPTDPEQMIGSMKGVELNTKTQQIIFPYGRVSLLSDSSVGYIDAGKNMKPATDASISTELINDSNFVLTQSWGADSVKTAFTANEDGTMHIVQTVDAESGGISSVLFGFDIPNTYEVILPTSNGVALSSEHPKLWSGTERIAYPDEWCMQMFLIQGEKGGLLVYAKDNATQFKALNLRSDDESFQISLETIPQAPFDDYKTFQTVEWIMVPYKGTWNEGAALYREYVDEAFGMAELYAAKPEWAKQIEVFVLSDLDDLSMLDELAKNVDASKTLIYYPAWRLHPYDVKYPDYTAVSGAKKAIDYAHNLGFRVMLHINMNACEPGTNAYESYSQYASLDPYTKKEIRFTYTDALRSYDFVQINPASAAWREFMVNTLVDVVNKTGADALHLDQSLLCYNDGRGLVDSMTSMQGNIEYHKQLAEALPNVALASESVTDINARYICFANSPVYGVDWSQQSYSEAMFDQITPVVPAVYDAYLSIYHWPGLPTTYNEEYYQAWYRSGNIRCGFKPTIMRCSANELRNPNETMQMFFQEANWFTENSPRNNYDDWSADTFMKYILADGTEAQWIQDANGEVLLTDVKDKSSELIRFVTDTENAKLPGTISGWNYYDDAFIRGLDSDKYYLYSKVARDPLKTHVTKLSDNLTLLNFQETLNYASVSFRKIMDDSKLITDFMAFSGPFRVGEVLYENPDDAEVQGGLNSNYPINLAFTDLAVYRHLSDRFLMHPPWLTEEGSIGYIYSEFETTLETHGNAVFSASVQMASAANAALSDGVTFKFFIWQTDDAEKADMITQTVEVTKAVPLPVTIDITQFEGKTVTIRVEVHPGKTTANDSAVIVSPRVVQVKAQGNNNVAFTMVTQKPITGMISSKGTATYKEVGTNTYEVTSELSDTVYFLYNQIKLNGNQYLADTELNGTWLYNDGTLTSPSEDLRPRKQVAEVNDELLEGIFAHPPEDGKCYVTFAVTIPANGKLTLNGSAGLKAGSNGSDGVTFSVMVNQDVFWEKTMMSKDGLIQYNISLAQYAGQTVLLSLVTDAGESSAYDYAFWGNPVLILK